MAEPYVFDPSSNTTGKILEKTINGKVYKTGPQGGLWDEFGVQVDPKTYQPIVATPAPTETAGGDAAFNEANLQTALREEESRIGGQYNIKKDIQARQQEQEKATSGAMQFKLGRAETPFAAGETLDLKNAQAFQQSLLRQEEMEAISLAKKAVRDQNYKEAALQQEKAKFAEEKRAKLKDEQLREQSAGVEKALKSEQTKKIQQEIVQENAGTYAGAMLSVDEQGNVKMPTDDQLLNFSNQTGIPLANLVNSVRDKVGDLSKLSAENRKREMDILKAQQEMIPTAFREFQYAQSNLGFKGTWKDFFKQKALAEKTPESAPASFREWQLAGGQAGTGQEYGEFLKKNSSSGLTPAQTSNFNKIVKAEQDSPLIKARDRAVILKGINSQLAKDRNNSSLQLSFIYSFVQALDTYQSAVREGEIHLVGQTQGLKDKLENVIPKLERGSILSADKVSEFLRTAEYLTNTIDLAARKKEKEFESQAKINGIQSAWTEYKVGAEFKEERYKDVANFAKFGSEAEIADFNKLKGAFPDKTPQELFDLYKQEKNI